MSSRPELNLIGRLHSKFHQHRNARYMESSLRGCFVPIAEGRETEFEVLLPAANRNSVNENLPSEAEFQY